MKTVRLEQSADPVLIATRQRVLDAVLAAKAKMLMACGGKGLCATCHVYVTAGAEQLSPRTKREELSLAMLSDVKPSSRLACQAKVLGEGVRIALPQGTYIQGTVDLEALVGRRADQRILHPVDGRVLIEQGKIITRSRIMELKGVDLDVAEMKARSMTVEL